MFVILCMLICLTAYLCFCLYIWTLRMHVWTYVQLTKYEAKSKCNNQEINGKNNSSLSLANQEEFSPQKVRL